MKKLLLAVFITLPFYHNTVLSAQCPAQCEGFGRYADSVFTCATVTPNIQYGTGLWDWSWTQLLCLNIQLPPYQTRLSLLADFYEPCDDTLPCRPLVIVIHGGAWAEGNKADLAFYAQYLAKRGYAVASINYRLSMPPNLLCWDVDADSIRLLRATMRAVQDAKAAVRFFRAHAVEYRIDPNNIFVAGVSAGAFTALGVGYMNAEEERPGACAAQPALGDWFGNLYFPDMGSIEGDGGNPGVSSSVRGVINMSGGLFNLGLLDDPNDPPLVSFHGTADDVVPYGYDCLLQGLRNANIYHHCIRVHGSQSVQQQATLLGMDTKFVTFPNGGHGYTPAEVNVLLSGSVEFLCEHLDNPVPALEPNDANILRIFPNPAGDHVTIDWGQGFSVPGELTIFNLLGVRIFSKKIEGRENRVRIDSSDWPPGQYVLILQTTEGQKKAMGKLSLMR